MKVSIVKKGERALLIVERTDGTVELSDVGPQLPGHDIAHYIVEQKLGMRNGFYGNIDRGYTVAQLSEKRVIHTLPPESMLAEIVTRALQALGNPSSTPEDFRYLIETEMAVHAMDYPIELTDAEIREMQKTYRAYLQEWFSLPPGETLHLRTRH